MRRFPAILLLGLLGALAHAGEGGREGSGGGGVACYDGQGKLASVQTLERWEYYPPFTAPFGEGATLEQILSEMERFLERYSPIFAQRMGMVAGKIDLNRWKGAKQLPRIDDATPKRPIPRNCRFVQLAVRYTRSRPGRLPEVQVRFNPAYFSRLSPFDQAMLIFHERMYLIGKETGHERSDGLRETIAKLYSKELRDALAGMSISQGAHLVQGLLVMVFGDYYRFFIEDPTDRPDFIPAGYTQWSRYESFGKFLLAARERKGRCLDRHDYDRLTRDEERARVQDLCSFECLDPATLPRYVDDEQAFLFVSRWILDRVGAIDNSENFVVWDRRRPDTMTAYQSAELKRACDHLRKSNYVNLRAVIPLALRYCDDIAGTLQQAPR